MVDNLLTVSTCGLNSLDMNILINKEIEMKNLRIHAGNNGKKSKNSHWEIGVSLQTA